MCGVTEALKLPLRAFYLYAYASISAAMSLDERISKAFGAWERRREALGNCTAAFQAASALHQSAAGPPPLKEQQALAVAQSECDMAFALLLAVAEGADAARSIGMPGI